jgi:hypothetical protein
MYMPKNLIFRVFDDDTHTQLGQVAQEKGVSINSIVRDAVDKWLQQQQTTIPKKHHLILYDSDDSMVALLKSMDGLAKDAGWFRCHAGPPQSRVSKYVNNLGWFEGTILPYEPQKQDVLKYCGATMERIAKSANDRQICCMDFLINDVAKSSLKQAMNIEHAYDNDRISGFMFCTYRTDTLLGADMTSILELFEIHDQVFVLKEDEVYKLHVSKESVHKFFIS